MRGLRPQALGGSKNPSVSPSPMRKEPSESSIAPNFNSSGSLLGGDGDIVDGVQQGDGGGEALVINIGEPGTGLPRSASTSSGSRIAAGKGADLRRSESAKDGRSRRIKKKYQVEHYQPFSLQARASCEEMGDGRAATQNCQVASQVPAGT